MENIVAKGMLIVYVAILIWLVIFKLNVNIWSVIDHHHRSLNLIPFAAPSRVEGRINFGEMIFNCVFFIPFGLLLNVNFKTVGFWPKLTVILLFSLTAELIQYIFAIGATDVTDLITNTLGGFLGLKLYDLSNKFTNQKKLDSIIIAVGIILLVLFLSMHVSHFIRRK
ncbi:VanZ family protein [Spirosoma sp. KNUC1025]|uniref:VanZ family protein n=1 Tax=Spirosoma sp. KNUC1025 TaxID=2894082 RepID=UPI003869515C|nr:VanZ family protein [Spirosoma sp. KNUC1025]